MKDKQELEFKVKLDGIPLFEEKIIYTKKGLRKSWKKIEEKLG